LNFNYLQAKKKTNTKTSKPIKTDYEKIKLQTPGAFSVFGLEFGGGFKQILSDSCGSH